MIRAGDEGVKLKGQTLSNIHVSSFLSSVTWSARSAYYTNNYQGLSVSGDMEARAA